MVLDYLTGTNDLSDYYRKAPSIDALMQVAREHSFSLEQRNVLVEELINQYQQVDDAEASEDNIKRLGDSRTFTVTTGHQLCLFGGPLYFFFKIAGAINLAQTLNAKQDEFHFVPVFWMATEDHDFEEINHAHVGNSRLAFDTQSGGAVGRMSSSPVEGAIKELEEILGDREGKDAILALLRNAYDGRTLAEATRVLVHQLFGKHGLVILDPDRSGLKKVMSPVFQDELEKGVANEEVSKTSARLAEQYKLQVKPRDLNLFLLDTDTRRRITRKNGEITLADGESPETLGDIEYLVQHTPEKLSPNVLLRPVYQEMILPNVAYIGGGAEVSYWLQLKGLFDRLGVSYPVVLLRNSCMLLGKVEKKKLSKLGLESHAIFKDEVVLTKEVVAEKAAIPSLENMVKGLSELYEEVNTLVQQVDPSLVGKAKAEASKAIKGLEGLEKAMMKAGKQKQENNINALRFLYNKLMPGGGLMERHDSFVMWMLQFGPSFVDDLVAELDPLDLRFRILSAGAEE